MNNKPKLSKYFESIQPSPIRLAGLEFARLHDADEVNVLEV